jgi:hypothetical protein
MADVRALYLRWGPGRDVPAAESRAFRLRYAADLLRSGEDLPADVRQAIADLIEEPALPSGRPKALPTKWYEAGVMAEEYPELTIQEIADRLCIEKRTAERGIAYFRKAKAQADEIDTAI